MKFIKNFLLKRRLHKVDENIKRFTYDGIVTYAKVVSIYDADTLDIIFEHNKETIRLCCRVDGIDTPELRTRNEEEKKLGYAARDYLRNLILGKIIKVSIGKFDKYGRILVKLYYKKYDIGELLIVEGYANKYDGGKKLPWF